MLVPEFEWKTYNIPVRSTQALEAVTDQTVPFKIPLLTPWAGSLEKAQVLLQTAAEVEHALLVQYLYAAFSLNKTLTDVSQHDAVASWFKTVVCIARQEMGHLMTVQNLLLALGFEPSLEREDFPPRKDLYPFSLHLERLSHRSLAKYIAAESPAGAEDIFDILELADVSEGAQVNRVGTIYGLLGFLFSAENSAESPSSSTGDAAGQPNTTWVRLIEDIAAALGDDGKTEAWHLPDSAICQDADADARQGDPSDWPDAAMTIYKISDRESALNAIQQIAAEGEGSNDQAISHFSRFRDMFRGTSLGTPFPPAGKWAPTLSVPTDPRTADITDQLTLLWSQLADLRYGMLLEAVEHYLRTTDPDARRKLASWAISEDMYDLARLSEVLTALPFFKDNSEAKASLSFTMPLLPLPNTEAARWEIHRERAAAAIAKITEIQDYDSAHAQELSNAQKDLLMKMLGFLNARDRVGNSTSFARDIRPLFRPMDVQDMNDPDHKDDNGKSPIHIDLSDFETVKRLAPSIASLVKDARPDFRMPPPPDLPWTCAQKDLFDKWNGEGCPP